MPGENVAALISLWAGAVWNRGSDDSVLAEDVVWEDAAGGRAEVLELLHGWDRPPRLTRLEAVERGDRVLLASEGPDLHAGGRSGPVGESYLVFTFRAGRVTRIRSFASRDDAEAALG